MSAAQVAAAHWPAVSIAYLLPASLGCSCAIGRRGTAFCQTDRATRGSCADGGSAVGEWGPLVLGTFVVAMFAVVFVRVWRYQRSLAARQTLAVSELLTFRAPAQVKIRLHPGWWSTRTLAGMELCVGTRTVWVTPRPRGIGQALGNQWYFDGPSTQIARIDLPRRNLRTPWIMLRGRSGSRDQEIAVSPETDFATAWQALTSAGCQVTIDQPPSL